MGISDWLGPTLKVFGERRRRTWIGTTRAHIEFRDVDMEELESFTSRLREAAGKLEQLRWLEVNPHTHRVILDFEPQAYSLAPLVQLVEEAERHAQLDKALFSESAGDHPADLEPAMQLLVELCADVGGFLLGSGLRFSILNPSSLGSNTAALMSVLRAAPRLRQRLDERLGRERSELALNLVSAFAQGVAQRPVSSLVDVAHKTVLLREVAARRRLWVAREAELCQEKGDHSAYRKPQPRPVPIPRGPIEEYADRAWMVSLSGFAVSFITTRSFQRAVAALFGGLPKPARLGRDVFAAELGRLLAERGVMVKDSEVLRRLDRVDCLVLQGDLVARDRFECGEVVTKSGVSLERARRHVLELFDPEKPVEIKRAQGWVLGPARALDAAADIDLTTRTNHLAERGALVLGLARDGELLAIAEMRIIPQTGVEELISAAQTAQMRVVISADDESLLGGLNADDVVPEGDALRTGIRRLQREGRCVCLVATGASPGLPVADVGIGLKRDGEVVPWGAHVVCGADLSDVRFLLQACVTARQVAKQSVNIALGAATTGALVSAGGILPMTTRRVIAVVNAATLISMGNAVRGSARLSRRALPAPRDRTPWHALDATGVLRRLGSAEEGLSGKEIALRARPDARKRSALSELGEAVTDELFNPLAPLLAAGAGLSAVVGSVADAGMVGGVVVLNALVGGVQRFRTERAIRRLAESSRRSAVVRRAGRLERLSAEELVPGDVILLNAGEVVPADCRVVDASSLEVDASSLTGESLPVKKSAAPSFDAEVADRASMLYEGTSIAAGSATAVVVAVGDETEAQRGAVGSRRDPIQSGVEMRLRSLINLTGPVALGAGVGLVGAGLLRGRKLEDVIGSGVSLAVASVPEGLPLLATAAQLAAAKRLSKRGALVRNARSIEALGRVNVLCVDKTGTVTEGRIDLSSVSDGAEEETVQNLGGDRVKVVAAALRAAPDVNHAASRADPTEAALARAAAQLGVQPDYNVAGWRRGSEVSFEAGRGYHAVLGQSEAGALLSVKGAPEVILAQCTRWLRAGQRKPLDDGAIDGLMSVANGLAQRGLRVLAVAERQFSADDRVDPSRLFGLSFVGFVAFSDPVRPSAAAALDRLRRAGVEVMMITGDHPSTAEAIASELSLCKGKRIVTGAELTQMGDDELLQKLPQIGIFARVTPAQKVRVVRALQRAGRCVAMVGDGANDAPAIRLANVGIAIGEHSTAAARAAADVVLTDERIETLVDAIVEGRAMWASVRDAVSILVGGNLGEIGFTLAAGLIDGRPPLNARQLLLVNLLTDVAPAMAIALRPPTAQTLQSLAEEGPDASLGKPLDRDIAARAAVTAAGAGTAWLIGRLTGTSRGARTVGLVALVGTQLGQTITSGNYTRPVMVTSAASAAVLAAIVQTPGLSQFFGCRPLGPWGWATAIGASTAATAASVLAPKLAHDVAVKLRFDRVFAVEEEKALPEA